MEENLIISEEKVLGAVTCRDYCYYLTGGGTSKFQILALSIVIVPSAVIGAF